MAKTEAFMENNSREKNKEHNSYLIKGLSMISQMAFTIIACIAIGVFAGRWLDGFLGTSPLFLLVLSLLGVGAAFKSIYDISKRM